MKKSLLNNKKITPSCSYCTHGKIAPGGENVLCKKYGIVETEHSCRKFSYDVLKRQPKRPKALEKYDAKDFALK